MLFSRGPVAYRNPRSSRCCSTTQCYAQHRSPGLAPFFPPRKATKIVRACKSWREAFDHARLHRLREALEGAVDEVRAAKPWQSKAPYTAPTGGADAPRDDGDASEAESPRSAAKARSAGSEEPRRKGSSLELSGSSLYRQVTQECHPGVEGPRQVLVVGHASPCDSESLLRKPKELVPQFACPFRRSWYASPYGNPPKHFKGSHSFGARRGHLHNEAEELRHHLQPRLLVVALSCRLNSTPPTLKCAMRLESHKLSLHTIAPGCWILNM